MSKGNKAGGIIRWLAVGSNECFRLSVKRELVEGVGDQFVRLIIDYLVIEHVIAKNDVLFGLHWKLRHILVVKLDLMYLLDWVPNVIANCMHNQDRFRFSMLIFHVLNTNGHKIVLLLNLVCLSARVFQISSFAYF
jgi:hypothetical protein